MDQKTTITAESIIKVPIKKVWEFWIKPEHIVHWAFASDDWEAPAAENDMCVGGKFKTVMAAKNKSSSFDFTGAYTSVKEHELIEYDLDDGRHVKVNFARLPDGVQLTETFKAEKINPEEMHRAGWQAILNNFRKYVEGN